MDLIKKLIIFDMSNKRQPNIQKNGKQPSIKEGEKCAAFEG